jgi:outer membrane protein assembly factor BamB
MTDEREFGMRSVLAILILGGVFAAADSAAAQGLSGGVIPRVPLRQHGLERAWVTQADIVPGRSEIASMALHKNLFFVQSNTGMLQAIDAETGRTIWRTQVGDRQLANVAPGIGDDFVCAANGANLYVLNRSDGRIRWESPLENAPTAGLSVGNNRVYIPTVAGRVESYTISELKDGKTVVAEPRQNQLFLGLSGIPQTPCLLTPEAIVVGDDEGSLFGFAPGNIGPRYSVQSYGEVVGMPAYHKGKVLFGSRDRYIYAVREMDGDILWRQSLDEAIVQSPVVIGDIVYVVTELSGIHQLNAENGDQNWFVPGVRQFISAGKNHIYVSDDIGRIRVLDAATGRQVDSLATEGYQVKYSNAQNDRIYLATDGGLLHCLRESALADPIVYRTNDAAKTPETQQNPLDAAAPADAAKPAVAAPAADDDAAADAEEEPAEDDADMEAEEPADAAAEVEDDDLGGFGEE